jgi:hypothetical protein
MDRGYGFLIGVFAVWRISYAVTYEDGPADALARLRAVVSRWGSVLDCFYCTSVWVALPASLVIETTGVRLIERVLLWLALSGAACLLHRLTERRQTALYWEEPEDTHVLRKPAPESRTLTHER